MNPASPQLHPFSFFTEPVSPLDLKAQPNNVSILVDVLTTLCEKAKEAPACTQFNAEYGALILFAITEQGGSLSLTLEEGSDPILFEHQGPGATILGWCASLDGFGDLEEAYGWAASEFSWLPHKPVSVKGEQKKLITI